MLNLLSNTVKFTTQGTVRIRVLREASAWSVEVVDNGVGIKADDQARIFEPFVQVDGSATRRHGGTGLGLAVSRDLAHLLGGDISVASMLDRGSCFTLRIPVRQEAAPIPAARPVAQPQAKL